MTGRGKRTPKTDKGSVKEPEKVANEVSIEDGLKTTIEGLKEMLQKSMDDYDTLKRSYQSSKDINSVVKKELQQANDLIYKLNTEKEKLQLELNSIPNWIKRMFI